MNTKILIVVALIGGALAYSLYSKKSLEDQLAQESDQLLSRLPQVTFRTLDGQPYNTQELIQSTPKGVFVHFWATWCGPCEAELPELLEHIETRGDEVVFLIVAINDELPKIKKFMSTLKISKERKVFWLLDNDSVHRNQFGTMKLPETFLFKGDGAILRRFVGPQEWLKPQFFDMFRPLNTMN